MSKTYNLGSKSDMKRFANDLAKSATNMAIKKASSKQYDYQCPHCGKQLKVKVGKNVCPHCQGVIEMNLDLKY